MSLIYQDQITARKGFYCHGFFTRFVAQLVDVDDFHFDAQTVGIKIQRRLVRRTVFIEQGRAETRQSQIRDVLPAQAFSRGQDDDFVGFFVRIFQILQNIDVH